VAGRRRVKPGRIDGREDKEAVKGCKRKSRSK
jgi:hypothetical protein